MQIIFEPDLGFQLVQPSPGHVEGTFETGKSIEMRWHCWSGRPLSACRSKRLLKTWNLKATAWVRAITDAGRNSPGVADC